MKAAGIFISTLLEKVTERTTVDAHDESTVRAAFTTGTAPALHETER